MIASILSKFQSFRNCLFQLFPYRAGATMDLIDTVAATTVDSIVKLSMSDLFRRKYSSLTDALSSLFRTNIKTPPTPEELKKQTLQITQLLAQECAHSQEEQAFALFAIDCTANPRIYANKVDDRSFVHTPNHIPGQDPITVGHEYSVIVYLPNQTEDQNLHWVVPLSVKRVESHQFGPQVGFTQLDEVSNHTVFKKYFCIAVADSAYSTRSGLIGVSKSPHVVQVIRMRGNRRLYRLPPTNRKSKRGRPQIYGEELLLNNPSQPDIEEETTSIGSKGRKYHILLERWNDVIMHGSEEERTHEHPFDVLRVTVKDSKGKTVYQRPLWIMIAGVKRREVKSKTAYHSYGRRYDIEHFFRFGKQKLGLVNYQTCETRHEENWYWIGILAYNMLYHARQLTQSQTYPWEKKRVQVITGKERPSQTQRDYGRIIRGIGTPAGIPKPRGKSPGRRLGCKSGIRPNRPYIRKSAQANQPESATPKIKSKQKKPKYARMQREWSKDRPPPTRC